LTPTKRPKHMPRKEFLFQDMEKGREISVSTMTNTKGRGNAKGAGMSES